MKVNKTAFASFRNCMKKYTISNRLLKLFIRSRGCYVRTAICFVTRDLETITAWGLRRTAPYRTIKIAFSVNVHAVDARTAQFFPPVES